MEFHYDFNDVDFCYEVDDSRIENEIKNILISYCEGAVGNIADTNELVTKYTIESCVGEFLKLDLMDALIEIHEQELQETFEDEAYEQFADEHKNDPHDMHTYGLRQSDFV